MKRIIFLSVFIFLLLSYSAFANVKGLKNDTLSGKYTPALTYNDSVRMIPAYALYRSWDTTSLEPYHFDVENMSDTEKVVLETDTSCCDFVQPYIGAITSNFGFRRYRYHYGIDIKLNKGDSVSAAFDGKVRFTQHNRSYGNVIIIRHNNGLETIYAHLSKILVHPNENVVAGEKIGLGGSTGHSTGNHLHFEIRYKGHPIDPTTIISFDNHSLLMDNLYITKNTFLYMRKRIYANKRYQPSNLSYIKRGNHHYYIVREGDTLYGISRKSHISVSELCNLNGMSRTTELRIGKRLLL
ncbi:MAG TPA: M23 family metallopeptidase [Bacteroidia bacterium]|nr:M23 family metallopeptidase [Bacteroidia bacterium]